MHADTRYHAKAPRSLSLGAALALNGAIIAGLIFSAPDFLPKPKTTPFEGRNIPLPVPLPTEAPKPLPKKIEPRTTSQPTARDPIVPTHSDATIETSKTIPDALPTIEKPADPGPTILPDLPKPMLPLVGANPDPRYLQDFQPEYPAQEMRAQRDGLVTLRVLIGADGRVKAVEPVSATSDAFFAVTKRQALGKWRFRPASRGGVAEESWKTMTVRFRIEDAR
ncbi:energy transducer TonB [Sphingomonas pokkalii]|uniref:Energy transducer TonB n=1 Tax=Sphingomonas pokkalii TaxID=2175090 RepID=A0A2U0SIT6_9SPHN|nr:energy transducer TonB [Sphingomonas pokkalii]PVX31266.1 energy transducer TonB [Sphingomonas pokkalii]